MTLSVIGMIMLAPGIANILRPGTLCVPQKRKKGMKTASAFRKAEAVVFLPQP